MSDPLADAFVDAINATSQTLRAALADQVDKLLDEHREDGDSKPLVSLDNPDMSMGHGIGWSNAWRRCAEDLRPKLRALLLKGPTT